jgi:hypothetical protein
MLSSALFNNRTFPKSRGNKRIQLKQNDGLVLFKTENPRIYQCKTLRGKSPPEVGDIVYLSKSFEKYRVVEVEARLEPGLTGISSKNCVIITVANA